MNSKESLESLHQRPGTRYMCQLFEYEQWYIGNDSGKFLIFIIFETLSFSYDFKINILLFIWKLNYQADQQYSQTCPATHPYAYSSGKYCCNTFKFAEWPEKGQSGHIGRSFSNCRGLHAECPSGINCVDYHHIKHGINTALKAGKYINMSHMTDLTKSFILHYYNSADFFKTGAKRLTGQKSEDRVLLVLRRNLL